MNWRSPPAVNWTFTLLPEAPVPSQREMIAWRDPLLQSSSAARKTTSRPPLP